MPLVQSMHGFEECETRGLRIITCKPTLGEMSVFVQAVELEQKKNKERDYQKREGGRRSSFTKIEKSSNCRLQIEFVFFVKFWQLARVWRRWQNLHLDLAMKHPLLLLEVVVVVKRMRLFWWRQRELMSGVIIDCHLWRTKVTTTIGTNRMRSNAN